MRHMNIAVIATLLILAALLPPARAQVLHNYQIEFTSYVPDNGCAGENLIARGILHRLVRNMPAGGFAVNLNVNGTLTGEISGIEYEFNDIFFQAQPQTDNGQNRIFHIVQKTIAVNGGTHGLQFDLNLVVHVVTIEGESVVERIDVSTTCNV